MTDYKQSIQTRVAELPIFSGQDASNIQLNPMKWRKGEKPFFNIASLLLILGFGAVVWFVLLPILGAMFAAFLQFVYIGTMVFLISMAYMLRGFLWNRMKGIVRSIHETFIKFRPFDTFREQREEMMKQEKEAVAQGGVITSTKLSFQQKAAEYEKKAGLAKDRLLEIQQESEKLQTELLKYTTDQSKEDPAYTELIIEINNLGTESEIVRSKYNQYKAFTQDFGVRANGMIKFELSYKFFLSFIKNRISKFDATVEMLKNDFDATTAIRRGTDAISKIALFENEWQVKAASEAVIGAIANNIAVNADNITNIKTMMLSTGDSMDSTKALAKLKTLTASIQAGTDIIPSASKYNNPELKLTSEEKVKSGFGGVFDNN